MSAQASTLKLLLQPADNPRLASLCGPLNAHLHQLEARFGIEIQHRGHDFQLLGEEASVAAAAGALQALYRQTEHAELSEDSVNRFLLTSGHDEEAASGQVKDLILRHSRLRAYGENQESYLAALQDHDLVFGVGPAGTGKTYWRLPKQSTHWNRISFRRLSWCARYWRPGSGWDFYPAT